LLPFLFLLVGLRSSSQYRKVVDAFDVDGIPERLRSGSSPYREFIRRESLSVGLYVLAAGAVDRQQPHGEDEI
jgi:hypothetical protein